jgi:hypothetical protein
MEIQTVERPAHTLIARHAISDAGQPIPTVYTTLDNIATIIDGISNLSYQEMCNLLPILEPIRFKHYLLHHLYKTIKQMRDKYTGPRPAEDEAQA